jgi:hypothetical protein
MARFSQALLSGLLNPAYQQELTQAARGLGMTPMLMKQEKTRQAEQQQLQSILTGDPAKVAQRVQQLRELAVRATSAQDRQKYTAAADALQKQAQSRGLQDIAGLMGQMQNAVATPAIDSIQQQINDIAVSTMQPDPTKFVEQGKKRKEEVTELLQDQSEQRINNVSNVIARSNVPIVSYIDKLPTVEQDPKNGFTEAEKSQLTKQSVDLRKIREGREELLEKGKLPANYKEALANNKELREQPAVQAALKVFERKSNPDSTVTPGELAKAADAIKAAVESEYNRQLTINRSTNRLEAQADRMVDALLGEGGISEWVYGEDLVEVVKRVKDDDDLSGDFRSFIAQEIEKNPDVDKNVAIKTALDLLGEKHDLRLEEGRLQNVEEQKQEAADREAAIAYLMDTEELSRKDAIRRLNEMQAQRSASKNVYDPSTFRPIP